MLDGGMSARGLVFRQLGGTGFWLTPVPGSVQSGTFLSPRRCHTVAKNGLYAYHNAQIRG
jgi:hypothetical protein